MAGYGSSHGFDLTEIGFAIFPLRGPYAQEKDGACLDRFVQILNRPEPSAG